MNLVHYLELNWSNCRAFYYHEKYFLPPASEGSGRYCFHRLCLFTPPRGTPFLSCNTSTGPMSFLDGTPVTGPRSLPRESTVIPDEVPVPGEGYPSPRQGVSQGNPSARARWGTPLARTGWGTCMGRKGLGYPPTRDKTPHRELGMCRAVCLFRLIGGPSFWKREL